MSRDSLRQRFVVAVDGPAGSGKGTICRAVARAFEWAYLDTGALYRAVALRSLTSLTSLDSQTKTIDSLAETMRFEYRLSKDGRFLAYLEGSEVSLALRDEQVGARASEVAAFPAVRAALLNFQRTYGGRHPLILDGRDVGTVVWPDAAVKIFLTATLEERAKRRALELQHRGKPVNFQEIRDRIAERDASDANRDVAPLMAARDAVVVDTTCLTVDEAIQAVQQIVHGVYKEHNSN